MDQKNDIPYQYTTTDMILYQYILSNLNMA